MIDSEAGCPDDIANVERGSLAEAHGESRGSDGSSVELDAASTRGTGARADQRVFSLLHPSADSGRRRLADQSGGVEVPGEVPAKDPLRQRHLARADRQVDLP